MPSCVFRRCKNYTATVKTKDISFHDIPKDELIKETWLKLIRAERCENDWLPTAYSTVCSEHFLASDKYLTKKNQRRLKKTAIPVLKIGSSSQPDGYSGTIQLPEAKEIITSVYRYLQTEYEYLKSKIDSNCDLTPLGNILKRTAEATGVSEQTVTSLLEKGKRPLESTQKTVQRKRAKSSSYFEDDDVSPVEEESSSEEKSEGHHSDDGQKAQSSPALATGKVEVEDNDEDHRDAVMEKFRVDIEVTSCETESAVLNLLSTTHSDVTDEPVDYHQQTSSAVQHLLSSEQSEINEESSDIESWQSTSAVTHAPPDAVPDPLKTELYDDD
ncbi:unnamed protein product [Arctia plantaginis]|uniref:THAP-type domain-containing protein n=1 Tax=Arctia plantaginis TaxID=874455 RepID=A0A8S1BTN1_ARCPL|nr:unnamed protein product [Arctia plantaginis]